MTDRIPARLRGVYFLFHGDQCVYVGSSVNILRRIAQHVTDGDKLFDSFAYHSMPNESQWDIETFEIQRDSPSQASAQRQAQQRQLRAIACLTAPHNRANALRRVLKGHA